MSWHEALSLEVEMIFRSLTPSISAFVENALYVSVQYRDKAWADHGQWWRKTQHGKRHAREYSRRQAAARKTVVVAVRHCIACNEPFEVSAYREGRGRNRVCSTACRGAARKNIALIEIDGKRKTLTQWAADRSLRMNTVWARIKRGWPVAKALGLEESK